MSRSDATGACGSRSEASGYPADVGRDSLILAASSSISGSQIGPPPTGAGVAVRVLVGAEGCVASAVAELLAAADTPVDMDGPRATTSRRCRSNPEACRGTALDRGAQWSLGGELD